RMSAIAIATAASIAVAGLFVSILGSQVFSHLEPAELILVLSSTAVACMIVSLVRDFAGEKLDGYVYRTRVNYQKTLKQASKELTSVLDLTVLVPFVGRTIDVSLKPEMIAIFISSESESLRNTYQKHCLQDTATPPNPLPAELVGELCDAKDILVIDGRPNKHPILSEKPI